MKKKTTVLERPKKTIAQETRDVINRKIIYRRWYKRCLKKKNISVVTIKVDTYLFCENTKIQQMITTHQMEEERLIQQKLEEMNQRMGNHLI